MLTGRAVRLRLIPAAARTGVVFVRRDLANAPEIAACVEQVTGTERRTSLGVAPAEVMLVEHVLAALAGMRVDNCWVELDGPEPPGGDGSAGYFVRAIEEAGIVCQTVQRPRWAVTQRLVISTGNGTIALYPQPREQLRISYLLDYGPGSPIATQRFTANLTPQTFRESIANARTFLLLQEAQQLQRQGIGTEASPADVLVFGPRGPINNRLRYADEPARHKVLDIVGDLSLLGVDLVGHIVACRSGHLHNVALARTLWHQIKPKSPQMWYDSRRAA